MQGIKGTFDVYISDIVLEEAKKGSINQAKSRLSKMKMYDPIVEEIREIRNAHSPKFNYDVRAIAEDFQKKHDSNILLLKEIKNNFNKISSLDSFSAPLQKSK